ncbi:MAG: hypothetical protein H0W47_10190 [Polaromonas sp.]|uniref:hypothetical protein n=1 Tax=Polaromonas sp. TaxID=1869339 RepID=UPI00182FAD00|nr:hypothetical protein [Polaromonas sp.]MBA3594151.1 hypothetical protein [Polaromonas sp.]
MIYSLSLTQNCSYNTFITQHSELLRQGRLHDAKQLNIRAGDLPPTEANGVAYLKIPLNAP